ncbi:hypothetical protein [Amycolatopsis echigonensis]|uniref:Uncharacterized protein n=1 Tax=Amycolatopsis echigonensis TaxID=2576905 RepID=A0A8E1VZ98_9PSEU|nr:hypothetical protein [Amycolatopsis echigonensis]MBB2501188.1 hypothetical protein [Amycolatopsis echigonensis]
MSILDRFRRDRGTHGSPYLAPAERPAVRARIAREEEEILRGAGNDPETARRVAGERAARRSVIRPEIAKRIDDAATAALEQANRDGAGMGAYRRAVKEECARAGVSEADFYRAEPGLLAMAWPSLHERLGDEEPVFDLDAEEAHERAEFRRQMELHGLADPQDGAAAASTVRPPVADGPGLDLDDVREAFGDDVEVVTIDPAQLMPAVEALRNYDLADNAVESYRRNLAEGRGSDDALSAVLDAQEPGSRALAEHAVALYLDAAGSGADPDDARHTAVAEAAAAATPRISSEHADQIRAALAEEPVGEPDVVDAVEPMTVAQARDIVVRAEELTQHLYTCSLGEEHCPTCSENILDADGFWDHQVGDARARLADYSLDDILAGNFTAADLEDAVPERDPEPGSWIARNLTANEQGDPFRSEAATAREADHDLRGLMTEAEARDTILRAERLRGHLDTCTATAEECATCSEYDPSRTDFWEVEVAAATSRLAGQDPDAVILVDTDRDEVVVVNPRQVAAEAADRIVGEPDVNDADWRTNPPAPSPVPERDPEPGSWIARNLAPADNADVGPVVDGERVYLEDVQARLARLADGPVTEESLAQVGLDASELHSLEYRQLPAAVQEFLSAERARVYEEELRAHEAERRDTADSLTAEQAQRILDQAAEIDAHTSGCQISVQNCPTCSEQEHDDAAPFWDRVAAAQDRLAGLTPDQITAQAAAENAADPAVVGQAVERDAEPGRGARAGQPVPAEAASDVDSVLGRIDEVLAAPEPPPLGDAVRECDRSLAEAENAVNRAQTVNEDDARAERCARWNSDDACAEAADCDRDCDGGERA